MNKVFSIESDLLGLVSFLVRGGNGNCQYGAGIWFLSEVRDQLKPKNIADYIINLAFDNLPSDILESYCKFAVGQASLTKTTERFLRDRGFLYGEIPKVPRLVKLKCKWKIKYVYES